jgi:hypothetical protein
MKVFNKMFPMIFQIWMSLGISRRDKTNLSKDDFALILDPNGSFFTQIGPHLTYLHWNLKACDKRKQTNRIKP